MKFVPLAIAIATLAAYLTGLFTWKLRWWYVATALAMVAFVFSIALNLTR